MVQGLADYHVHIERGPYCAEWVQRFLDYENARGVDELGLSEHGHRFRGYEAVMGHLGCGEGSYPQIASWMGPKFKVDLHDYVAFAQGLQNAGWPLKLGTEVDYVPGHEREITAWLAAAPWDYVIGSVHFIGKWGFDHSPDLGWPERSIDEAYLAYFKLVAEAARSRLFDIIGHFDIIKIFGHRPTNGAAVERAMETALREVRSAGCALDVNTAGWRRPVTELYPATRILQRACELGIPITFGSDAHEPQEAGYRLREAAELARKAGYHTATRFSQRVARQVPLN